jgi:monofunctional biosynthetic peptidoglycan transglycosylase
MTAGPSPVFARLGRVTLWLLALAAVALLALGALWGTLPDPSPLARENPKTTALIEQRKLEAKGRGRRLRVQQSWVGLDRVSKRLVDAVVLAEDARFFGHEGIDWPAMRDAARHDMAAGNFARGASTITQQLAKNLWFGTDKSLWRKAKEAVLASKLERALSKRRILALYLGVAEWGDGVFGIEAGARLRFGVSAAQLTTAQAVVMASMLPAPRRVDLDHPSRWIRERAHRLLDRMRDEGGLGNDEHLRASAELERILAGAAPPDDTGSEEPPEEESPPASAAEPASPPESEPAAAPTSGSEPETLEPKPEEPSPAAPTPSDPTPAPPGGLPR